MVYDTNLADKVREYLAEKIPGLEIVEKEMFNVLNFMVNGKTCICISGENLMLRFDPKLQAELSEKNGYETMYMKGKEYKGYCYVNPDGFKAKENFEYFVNLCIEYNKISKQSKKKSKQKQMEEKSRTNYAIPLLPSISINETKEFYKAIGSEITYQQKAPNNYIGLKLKSIEIHFFGMAQIKPTANFSSSYLVVDDIDDFYKLCRDGLKEKYGKIPIKGIPRINQIKDMPTYGVRQFIIVDPSGNYLRIGQPIPKTDSVLFEENGKKPQKGTKLTKAYELADRLANGKDDLEAAIKVIDKVLLETTDSKELIDIFKIVTLRAGIAHKMDDLETMKQMIKKGNKILKQLDDKNLQIEDITNFRRLTLETKSPNR